MSHHTYRVNYAFERADSETLPETQRWGFGYLDIHTDKEPKTHEEYQEILRTIGMQGGYKSVRLQTISEKTEDNKPTSPFIAGEILDI